jgi:NAD(P)H-quinone oxidoreductase subunit 1
MILNTNFEESILNLFYGFHFSKDILIFIWIILSILTLILRITIGELVLVWLGRKISVGIQRIGPEYASPLGIIQVLADGIKLLLNEHIILSRRDTWLFHIGLVVVVIPIFLNYLVIFFGCHIILIDLNIDVFFCIAICSIVPLGLLMARYRSNNKYSFLGGL